MPSPPPPARPVWYHGLNHLPTQCALRRGIRFSIRSSRSLLGGCRSEFLREVDRCKAAPLHHFIIVPRHRCTVVPLRLQYFTPHHTTPHHTTPHGATLHDTTQHNTTQHTTTLQGHSARLWHIDSFRCYHSQSRDRSHAICGQLHAFGWDARRMALYVCNASCYAYYSLLTFTNYLFLLTVSLTGLMTNCFSLFATDY